MVVLIHVTHAIAALFFGGLWVVDHILVGPSGEPSSESGDPDQVDYGSDEEVRRPKSLTRDTGHERLHGSVRREHPDGKLDRL